MGSRGMESSPLVPPVNLTQNTATPTPPNRRIGVITLVSAPGVVRHGLRQPPLPALPCFCREKSRWRCSGTDNMDTIYCIFTDATGRIDPGCLEKWHRDEPVESASFAAEVLMVR